VEHLQNAHPTVQTLPHVIFEHFQHELPAQKFSTNAQVKPATAATLPKTPGNGLLCVVEKLVGCCKKCTASEGHHYKKETVSRPQESSDREQCEQSHYFSNSPCVTKYLKTPTSFPIHHSQSHYHSTLC
jgi:hypothetical protein